MVQRTIEQAFEVAVQHHQAGQLPQAEALYRQILSQQPNHADALHLLGVIAHQLGHHNIAVDLITRAIAIKSNYPEAHINLGIALKDKGRFDDAIAAFRQAIRLRPHYPEAYNSLGNALKDKRQLDEAIIAYRQAITLRSHYPEAHNNLANSLKDKGLLDEAIATYHQAITLKPDYYEAHYNLGIALYEMGNLNEAVTAYRHAITLKPDYSQAHYNLGIVLHEMGNLDEAVTAYRHAITLKSNFPEAYCNLGNVLRDQGQPDAAITAYRQAIALRRDLPEAYCNLGNALKDKGQLDEAVAAYRQAIVLQSDAAEAHKNLALVLLTQGNFSEGWAEYEWRWKCKDFRSRRRNVTQPQWDGRSLEGATLLLHAEQGFGDTLQFIRYLPLVDRQGGKIISECQPELQKLLQTMPGNYSVVARGEPLPAFDVHCPLLSLPQVFRTTLNNIPRQVPYLYADAEATEKWRARLSGDNNPIKVGLAWAGSKTNANDGNRSVALSAYAPLGRLHGISFYSLQKGDRAEQARTPPAGLELIDWTDDLKDFADTAALIANLDLVITVDTAVAHLAGAMGKQVWVFLPFVPDWRWLLEREDSPWYPTMRLFRQTKPGDWDDVVHRVREALTKLSV